LKNQKAQNDDIPDRFSQDISLIDVQLPNALLQTLDGAFLCLMEGILIVSSDKYLAISVPLCLGVLYLVQKYYLRTSRQIRLLDIEAKSPLYTTFLETTEGVETIRAFGWQQHSERRYYELLDASQKPFYLQYCIQRWLNLVLDLVVAGFAVLAMALATQLTGASAGSLGIALTNLLTFNASLAYLIQAWTALETSIGSIARVKSFIKSTPSELSRDFPSELSPSWPENGVIVFSNYTASYRYNFPFASSRKFRPSPSSN
jgi:ATP-binding cassette subfamily C (CFTR/MRP) protein 1